MSQVTVGAWGCIAVASVLSLMIGSFGVRFARSTTDFLIAARTVGTPTNAAAVSGEYLAAASFLGVAGLVLKDGPDALWYPIGFAFGYFLLIVFVAAPMRRSGVYTLPDFVEYRLRSRSTQRLCAGFTAGIGWMLLGPQLQGAGLTIAAVVPGLPIWPGTVAAGVMVVVTVVFGGMRSITFVQAFQFWLKVAALAVPVVVLSAVVGSDHRPYDLKEPPRFLASASVTIHTPVVLRVTEPVQLSARGTIDRRSVDGPLVWEPGNHSVAAGTTLEFEAGDLMPMPTGVPVLDATWVAPANSANHDASSLYEIYAVLLACGLGALGLPHVVVRFFTNPDGRRTRLTGLVVLAMLGGFYLLPTPLGVLSRLYVPRLLITGDSDAAVLALPAAVLGGGWAGGLVGGLVAAGAWAAFLSTATGLLIGVVSAVSASPTVFRPNGWGDFRMTAVVMGLVPILLALALPRLDFMVAMSNAFTVAASAFAPMVVLGIWWRGLTDRGAFVGMFVGCATSGFAVLFAMLGVGAGEPYGIVLAQPAVITVPLSFLLTVVVSRLTARRIPEDVAAIMRRLHVPERLVSDDGATPDEQRGSGVRS